LVNEFSAPQEVDAALDAELRTLFMAGEGLAEMRQLLHAVQSDMVRSKGELRLSHATLAGVAAESPPHIEEPETWEATLLQAHALLTQSRLGTPRTRALVATAWLLAFDLYWRGGVWATLLVGDLSPPARHQAGVGGLWSVTQFPATGLATSKTRQHDLTGGVGATCAKRRWLQQLCPLLQACPRGASERRLFPLHQDEMQAMFVEGRRLAGLRPSHLHRLRHGGASVDGMDAVADSVMLERGSWAALRSLMRYRRPARYLRQLALLTKQQVELAQTVPTRILAEVSAGLR